MAAEHESSIFAARGETDEAVKLYKQARAIISLSQCVSVLGDLYTFKGETKSASEQYDLVLYIYM